MSIPLINYIRTVSPHRLVKLAALGLIVLTCIAVLGTQSRGGLITLAVTGLFLLLKSRHKLLLLIPMLVGFAAFLSFAPDAWLDRMQTIKTADEDTSFMGRWYAWECAWELALSRPLTGVGMGAVETGGICLVPRAAHSIYFQIMGDHGFVGLGLFLALLASAWLNCARVVRMARRQPSLFWAGELGSMLQVAIIAYAVGGAALSLAYYNGLYVMVAASFCLSRIAAAQGVGQAAGTLGVRRLAAAGPSFRRARA